MLFAAGLIALLGDVAFMYLLAQAGAAFGTFASADPAAIPNAGVPPEAAQQSAKEILGVINIAWLWALSVLIAALAMIYHSSQELFGRKKK